MTIPIKLRGGKPHIQLHEGVWRVWSLARTKHFNKVRLALLHADKLNDVAVHPAR